MSTIDFCSVQGVVYTSIQVGIIWLYSSICHYLYTCVLKVPGSIFMQFSRLSLLCVLILSCIHDSYLHANKSLLLTFMWTSIDLLSTFVNAEYIRVTYCFVVSNKYVGTSYFYCFIFIYRVYEENRHCIRSIIYIHTTSKISVK